MYDDEIIEVVDGEYGSDRILAHTPQDPQQKKVVWEAPEYLHVDKEPNWFWALGIIAVGLTIIAFLLDNPLLAIIVVIGAFTIALFAARKPEVIEFEITTIGIRADTQIYAFEGLQSFRIFEFDDFAQLLLKSKKAVVPVMTLIMPLDSVQDVRNQLLFTLNEEEIGESVAQTVFNHLGF